MEPSENLTHQFITKHPGLLLVLSTLVVYLTTGGTPASMNLIKTVILVGVFMAGAIIFVTSSLNWTTKKSLLSSLIAVPFAFLFYFLLKLPLALFTLSLVGGVIVLMSFVSLILTHRLNTTNAIVLIMMAGFWARVIWVIITPSMGGGAQHDTGFFDHTYVDFNDDYILYFYENMRLPAFDVREHNMFYHPPLHYFLSALMVKLNAFIFPSHALNYDSIQILTLLYSLLAMLFTYKILKLIGLKSKALVASFAVAALFPEGIILSASINNDSLSVTLGIMAFYFGLKWYQERRRADLLLTAVTIGLAMMTKLSAVIIALPVGVMMLYVLYKEKGGRIKLLLNYLLFGAIAFPLGLWFPVRNLIGWGVPLTYISALPTYSARMDLRSYSVVDRLFGIGPASSTPFLVISEDIKDFNVFAALLKTSLFDEQQYLSVGVSLYSQIMLSVLTILSIVSVIGLVLMTIRCIKSRKMVMEAIMLDLLFAGEMFAYIKACFDFPVVCTMNFRYVVFLIIPFVGGLGSLMSNSAPPKSLGSLSREAVKWGGVVLAGMALIYHLVIVFVANF